MSLTPKAISAMFRMGGTQDNPSFLPVVQVVHLKKIDNKGGGDERWKIYLSDGMHFLSGMCATQLNPLVHSGVISQFSVLRVTEFIVNTLGSGVKICILLGCEPASPNPGERIGSPIDVSKVPLGGASSSLPQSQGGGGGGGGGGSAQPMYGGGNNNPYGRGSPGGGGGGGMTNNGGNRFGGGGGGGGGARRPSCRTSNGTAHHPDLGTDHALNRWTSTGPRSRQSRPCGTWSNARAVDLLGAAPDGTCAVHLLSKEAVDKFHGFLEEGTLVYTFSGVGFKVAEHAVQHLQVALEITFGPGSETHTDGTAAPPQGQAGQPRLLSRSTRPRGRRARTRYVDILAVVEARRGGGVMRFNRRAGGSSRERAHRRGRIPAQSQAAPRGSPRSAVGAQDTMGSMPAVAFKLRAPGGVLRVDPNVPQARSLRQWWAANGNNGGRTAARSLSTAMGGNRGPDPFDQRKSVCAIKSEQMGYNDKPDWLSFKATITFLKKEKQGDEGAWYTACANADDPCKNMYKATQTSDGNWHCDKCMKTYENCVRRFIFSGTVADDTCTSWVSVFNEQAEVLLDGAKANDLYAQVANGDGKDLYDSTFMKATYTDWIIKCKVKQELVGDEQRVKTSMVSLSPVDYVAESRNLLKALCA
ncbi:hypothetical protein ACHAW5_002470 [Stephanodiscus triporus]|uniref:Replication protein A subunit n=1 Tax=Stephanodiscus triporus TaxID=2934178 RepID=A0ABD3QMN5_9STRA